MQSNDTKYLQRAIELAREAVGKGSNPVGAIIVDDQGTILAEGFNRIKIDNDATAHGEVVAIRNAGKKVLRKYNPEPTTLYTTLEPCFACGFFMTRTNIKRIVWAVNDPYRGGIEFLKNAELLVEDFAKMELVAEPDSVVCDEAKTLMHEYYANKGQVEIANMFI